MLKKHCEDHLVSATLNYVGQCLIHVVVSATAKNNSTCKSSLEALQIPGYLWGLQILHIPAKAKSIPPLGRRAMVSLSDYISIYLLHFLHSIFWSVHLGGHIPF
jgi:hypothetical protein